MFGAGCCDGGWNGVVWRVKGKRWSASDGTIGSDLYFAGGADSTTFHSSSVVEHDMAPRGDGGWEIKFWSDGKSV